MKINSIIRNRIIMITFLIFTMFFAGYAQFQMEWGKQVLQNETWTQINTSTFFIDPIVVATPEYNSTTQAFGIEVQITNITNTSFMIRSYDENLGSEDNITAHYIILERGSWTLPDSGIKIEAGSINTNKIGSSTSGWSCPTYGETITFSTAFNNNPLILATKASNNNPNTWSTTFKNDPSDIASPVTTSQMCIGHSFSKAISPGSFTNNELLTWIAIDQGNGTLVGSEYEILWQLDDTGDSGGNWINGYADPRPFTQSWAHTWVGAPNIILGGITSVAGGDGGWAVIHDTGNTGSIRIFVDEPNERAHSGSESGGGFAFNNASYIEALNNISWDASTLNLGFGVITNGSIIGDTTITSYKDNSNIDITCISGDCGTITTNLTSVTLSHDQSSFVSFTCSNATTGSFNAQFGVNSTQDLNNELLNVSCQIFKEFGDINATLNNPIPFTTSQIAQNRTFTIETTITCSGDINTSCGNITAYPRYNGSLINLGDGSDGSLTISTANTIINNYTYLTGNELNGSTSIIVNDTSAFGIGDDILIIQMQNGSGIGSAGNYEYRSITNIVGTTITLDEAIDNSYGSGTFNNVASSATQIVRIPQYSSVTINSGTSITAPSWNGFTGGIVIFRSQSTTIFNGDINVSEKGFRGGTCGTCSDGDWGTQGEGYLGIGGQSTNANGNGGGGGYGPTGFGGEGGAGGGYGTTGGDSVSSFISTGGNSIGDANLSTLFFGGGGGAGGDNDDFTPFPENTSGGGIVIVFSQEIVNASIEANGEAGIYSSSFGGVSGSGAGGSIHLLSEIISIDTLNAQGGPAVAGSAPDVGGAGGDGRIALEYITLNTGTSNPAIGSNITIIDNQIIISNTTGFSPLWSLDPQYQTCLNMQRGETCNLSWTINVTGDINSTHLIDVFSSSNIPVVSESISENTTIFITDNVIPVITITYPVMNSKYIVNQTNFNISYSIADDDTNVSCLFYINSILNETSNCNTGINLNFSQFVLPRQYSTTISVIDSLNNTINETINFTIIYNSHKEIEKKIRSLSTDLYLISMNYTNYINVNENTTIFNKYPNSYTPGSYSLFPIFTIPFVDESLIAWNTLNLSENFNYSITPNSYNSNLKEIYNLGLE